MKVPEGSCQWGLHASSGYGDSMLRFFKKVYFFLLSNGNIGAYRGRFGMTGRAGFQREVRAGTSECNFDTCWGE